MINLFRKHTMSKEKEKVLDVIYEYAGKMHYHITELRQTKNHHEYAICDPKNKDISLIIKVVLSDYNTLSISRSYAVAESLGKIASDKASTFGETFVLTYANYKDSPIMFEMDAENSIIKSMDYIKLIRAIV